MDSVLKKKRRSLPADDNVTPRTLIQGFLQTAQTVRQSPRKRARVTPSSTRPQTVRVTPSSTRTQTVRVTPSSTRTQTADLQASAQRRRTRTPHTLSRAAPSNRRRSTRPEILATPGGSNPTPRGLITGFLQAADIQTPAVHVGTRRSSPRQQPTPATQHRNVLQARAESTNSSSIESPVDDALSRFARPQGREGRSRRQRPIDPEVFTASLRDRISQEERDKRTDGNEIESFSESTEDRSQLDSILEEDISLPRPDSTTRDTSGIQAPGSSRSSRRSRRSLLGDTSFQLPSTSTRVDDPAEASMVSERRASHPSASSVEDDTTMGQATQETIQARLSSNTSTEDDERREDDERGDGKEDTGREDDGSKDISGRDEGKNEGLQQLAQRSLGGREAVAAIAEDVMDRDEEEEGEEGMDIEEDEDFDEENMVAPTQPAHLESLKKSSRAGMASPLNTPHLRGARRHPTPKAKTPAPFRDAADTRDHQLLHLKGIPGRKPPAGRSKATKEPPSTLPKSLTRGIFSHFSKARVPRNTLAIVDEVSSKYFKNISKDLLAYCKHAGRSTIERADMELLMKRQRIVSDKEPLASLIEKYLPLEYREELIPMARSGNKVYPKMPKK